MALGFRSKGFLVTIAVMAATVQVAAQEYPSSIVRVIVPYPAGGPGDVAMRSLAAPLSEELGQTIVIENRAGAGGRIGTEAAAQAKPDGYTLLVGGAGTFVVIPAAQQVRYDPMGDFIPLAQLFYMPPALVVRRSLGLNTMAEVVAYAKANPGKLLIGHAGIGTNPHVAILLWARAAGIDVSHVPYRTTPLWVSDVLGNQIPAGMGELRSVAPYLRSGELKAIAVASPKRIPQFPDVPTMAESGYANLETESWFGLFALSGTPKPVIERLNVAIRAAQANPAYVAAIERDHSNPGDISGEAFTKFVHGSITRLAPFIRSIRTQIE
jgi:tripartite-type tricarboxylate transporter receptor subunit TctC